MYSISHIKLFYHFFFVNFVIFVVKKQRIAY